MRKKVPCEDFQFVFWNITFVCCHKATLLLFQLLSILDDTEKTEQKKQELESILEQYNELISIYNAKIEEVLR